MINSLQSDTCAPDPTRVIKAHTQTGRERERERASDREGEGAEARSLTETRNSEIAEVPSCIQVESEGACSSGTNVQ